MVSNTVSPEEREKISELAKGDLTKYFFDSYKLKVSKVFVYTVPDVEKWREVSYPITLKLIAQVPDIQLLPPFNLDLVLKVRHVPVLSVPNIVYVQQFNFLDV